MKRATTGTTSRSENLLLGYVIIGYVLFMTFACALVL